MKKWKKWKNGKNKKKVAKNEKNRQTREKVENFEWSNCASVFHSLIRTRDSRVPEKHEISAFPLSSIFEKNDVSPKRAFSLDFDKRSFPWEDKYLPMGMIDLQISCFFPEQKIPESLLYVKREKRAKQPKTAVFRCFSRFSRFFVFFPFFKKLRNFWKVAKNRVFCVFSRKVRIFVFFSESPHYCPSKKCTNLFIFHEFIKHKISHFSHFFAKTQKNAHFFAKTLDFAHFRNLGWSFMPTFFASIYTKKVKKLSFFAKNTKVAHFFAKSRIFRNFSWFAWKTPMKCLCHFLWKV